MEVKHKLRKRWNVTEPMLAVCGADGPLVWKWSNVTCKECLSMKGWSLGEIRSADKRRTTGPARNACE
jgi:hypothetical protein